MDDVNGAGNGDGPTGRRFLGIPEERLQVAWTITDIADWLGVGLTKARELMRAPDAPPRLRTGTQRCDRWSPHQVLAWLHGLDWTALDDAPAAVPTGAPAPAERLDADPDAARPATQAAGRAGPPGRPWTPPPPSPLDRPSTVRAAR